MNRRMGRCILFNLFTAMLLVSFSAFAFGAEESGKGETGEQVAETGRVESLDDRVFTLNTGERTLTVDTGDMDYNPLKRPGLRSIEEGDRVTVTGQLTGNGSEPRRIKASSVVIRASAPGMDGEVDEVPDPDEPAVPPKPVLP